MALVAALTAIVSACSHTEEKPAPVQVIYLRAEVPPSSRKPCVLTELPDRDLDASETHAKWAPDRNEVKTCDARRAAAVAAIDAVPVPESNP
jgi:hypothetical protein